MPSEENELYVDCSDARSTVDNLRIGQIAGRYEYIVHGCSCISPWESIPGYQYNAFVTQGRIIEVLPFKIPRSCRLSICANRTGGNGNEKITHTLITCLGKTLQYRQQIYHKCCVSAASPSPSSILHSPPPIGSAEGQRWQWSIPRVPFTNDMFTCKIRDTIDWPIRPSLYKISRKERDEMNGCMKSRRV